MFEEAPGGHKTRLASGWLFKKVAMRNYFLVCLRKRNGRNQCLFVREAQPGRIRTFIRRQSIAERGDHGRGESLRLETENLVVLGAVEGLRHEETMHAVRELETYHDS